MKNSFKLLLLFLSFISISLYSQEKISSKKNINKFQINKSFYIGKKIKDLLKNLNIDIMSIQLEEGNEIPNTITLRFNNKNDYRKMISKNSSVKPSKIIIMIKENDNKTQSLFKKNNQDSTSKIIERTQDVNTNEDFLKDYLDLTIINIISVSEN